MIKKAILLTIAVMLFHGAGCSSKNEPAQEPPVKMPELPGEINSWIENSLPIFAGQAYKLEDKLYILVTYGEKPTGGYSVTITETAVSSEKISVTAVFEEPAENEMVTEALTYPYDLYTLDNISSLQPLEFNAQGAESYLPAIYGIDHIKPITAGSTWIKLFSPEPGSSIDDQLKVSGIANVFEGNVQYRLTDSAGNTLEENYTTAMMGDWGYFEFIISIKDLAQPESTLTLELYTLSPKDGSVQEQVTIDLHYDKDN